MKRGPLSERIVIFFPWNRTGPLYVPAATRIVSPSYETATASWIVPCWAGTERKSAQAFMARTPSAEHAMTPRDDASAAVQAAWTQLARFIVIQPFCYRSLGSSIALSNGIRRS